MSRTMVVRNSLNRACRSGGLLGLLLALSGVSTQQAADKLVVGHQMLHMPRYGLGTDDDGLLEEIRQWHDMGLDAVMLFDLNDDVRRSIAKRYHAVSVRHGVPVKFALTHFNMGKDPDYVRLSANYLKDLARPESAAARLFFNGEYLFSSYFQVDEGLFDVADLAEPAIGPVHTQPDVAVRDFIGAANTQPYTNGWITSGSQRIYEIMAGHPDWARSDGFAQFNISVGIDDQAAMIRALWRAAKARGKSARGAIVPYYRGLAYGNWMCTESWGYKRLVTSWQAAIDSGIPCIEYLTLNDFNEASYFNSWAPGDPPVLVRHWNTAQTPALLDHSGFAQFSRRYIQWFKTGSAPPIEKDELYFAYRLHPRNAASFYYLADAEKEALAPWIAPSQPADRLYRKDTVPTSVDAQGANGSDWGKFSDGIHIAVRLTAPAEIFINGVSMGTYGAGEHLVSKPGAIAEGNSPWGYPLHTFGPSDFGYPTFEIRRQDKTVLNYTGELEITPYCVPGAWNILARQAIAGRVGAAVANFHHGQNIIAGEPTRIEATVTGDVTAVERVEFFDRNQRLGVVTMRPFVLDWTPSRGTHRLSVRVVKRDGGTATSDPVNVSAIAPPRRVSFHAYEMISQDVGAPAVAGSASAGAGELTVRGAGTDVFGTADEFHFAHVRLEGDGTVIARVNSLSGTGGARAGLMVRESLSPGARHVFVFTNPNMDVAETFRREAESQATYPTYFAGDLSGPVWLRLQRRGNEFVASYSTNGTDWKTWNAISWWNAPRVVYCGAAVTARDTGDVATAVFSDLKISGRTLPAPAAVAVTTPIPATP